MLLIFRSPEEFRRHSSSVLLTPDEVRHLRARRLRPGDALFLSDGQGQAAPAIIVSGDSREFHSVRPDFTRIERQRDRDRIVFSALPKGSRLELVAEKGTELGMTRFVPVEFERSVRETMPMDRLRRLAEQAASQSGRFRLPVFDMPISFEDLLGRVAPRHGDADMECLMLDPDGDAASSLVVTMQASVKPLAIIIGPEGGFSTGERVGLSEAGARPVRVADGILRIETAVLAGLTLLQMIGSRQG